MTDKNPDTKPKQVNFHCDPELWAELKTKSIAEGISLRILIMRALAAFGFNVPAADLEDKRK